MAVTVNCDMGEAFGIWRLGDDEGCMPFITLKSNFIRDRTGDRGEAGLDEAAGMASP